MLISPHAYKYPHINYTIEVSWGQASYTLLIPAVLFLCGSKFLQIVFHVEVLARANLRGSA